MASSKQASKQINALEMFTNFTVLRNIFVFTKIDILKYSLDPATVDFVCVVEITLLSNSVYGTIFLCLFSQPSGIWG